MIPESKLDRASFDVEITDPFFIFEIESFFTASFFDALKTEFPDKSLFSASHDDRGGKSYLNNRMPQFFDFIELAPSWGKLYKHFAAETVITKLWGMANVVASERPHQQTRPWRLARDPDLPGRVRTGDKIFTRIKGVLSSMTPVQMGFEFSHLENGCYIPPHTDVIKKLISLMIYFPDEGVDYDQSAGTEFYRGLNNTPAWNAWKSGMLPDNEAAEFYAAHERFYVSSFAPNKLVGFVKSSNSWHGVRQVKLPPGATRRSVNINYFSI